MLRGSWIYESGAQERGLDWLFKALGLNEFTMGVGKEREEQKTKD